MHLFTCTVLYNTLRLIFHDKYGLTLFNLNNESYLSLTVLCIQWPGQDPDFVPVHTVIQLWDTNGLKATLRWSCNDVRAIYLSFTSIAPCHRPPAMHECTLREYMYEYKNALASSASRCCCYSAFSCSRVILCSKCGVRIVNELNTSTLIGSDTLVQVQPEPGRPSPDFPTQPPYKEQAESYGGQSPPQQLAFGYASRLLQAAGTVTW